MIDPHLLAFLRCPATQQPLQIASAEQLARLSVAAEAALVREDGLIAYPIRDGIPVLLADEAISVSPAN